jgi:hypothetical protein
MANYADKDFELPHLCQKISISLTLPQKKGPDGHRAYRLNKAKSLLETGAANVAETVWRAGFKDSSYFSKLCQEKFKKAPITTNK